MATAERSLTPFPEVVFRCLACLMLRTWSAMTRVQSLVCMHPHRNHLLMMLPPHTINKFTFRIFHPILLWCRVIEMMSFSFPLRTYAFLSLLHFPSSCVPSPCLAAEAGEQVLAGCSGIPYVGIVRCIEKLLIACASMNMDSCCSAR
jgi:hypothetical protein